MIVLFRTFKSGGKEATQTMSIGKDMWFTPSKTQELAVSNLRRNGWRLLEPGATVKHSAIMAHGNEIVYTAKKDKDKKEEVKE